MPSLEASEPRGLVLARSDQAYLLRILPKSWRDYIAATLGLSLGLYLVGVVLAVSSGTTSAFFSSPEWWFEPLYLTTHMVVLKLLYDIFSLEMPKSAQSSTRLRRTLAVKPT